MKGDFRLAVAFLKTLLRFVFEVGLRLHGELLISIVGPFVFAMLSAACCCSGFFVLWPKEGRRFAETRTERSSEHRQRFHVGAMVSDKFPMMKFDWYWLLKMRNADSRLPGDEGTTDRLSWLIKDSRKLWCNGETGWVERAGACAAFNRAFW